MVDRSPDASRKTRPRPGAILLILTALVALVLTGWRYYTPLSGITGTGGALLAMFGCFMLIVAGIIFLRLPWGGWRVLFLVLTWAGVMLTMVAELFLHGWASAIVLAIGIVAILIETFTPAPRRSV